jgi:hypothetical protein
VENINPLTKKKINGYYLTNFYFLKMVSIISPLDSMKFLEAVEVLEQRYLLSSLVDALNDTIRLQQCASQKQGCMTTTTMIPTTKARSEDKTTTSTPIVQGIIEHSKSVVVTKKKRRRRPRKKSNVPKVNLPELNLPKVNLPELNLPPTTPLPTIPPPPLNKVGDNIIQTTKPTIEIGVTPCPWNLKFGKCALQVRGKKCPFRHERGPVGPL